MSLNVYLNPSNLNLSPSLNLSKSFLCFSRYLSDPIILANWVKNLWNKDLRNLRNLSIISLTLTKKSENDSWITVVDEFSKILL